MCVSCTRHKNKITALLCWMPFKGCSQQWGWSLGPQQHTCSLHLHESCQAPEWSTSWCLLQKFCQETQCLQHTLFVLVFEALTRLLDNHSPVLQVWTCELSGQLQGNLNCSQTTTQFSALRCAHLILNDQTWTPNSGRSLNPLIWDQVYRDVQLLNN